MDQQQARFLNLAAAVVLFGALPALAQAPQAAAPGTAGGRPLVVFVGDVQAQPPLAGDAATMTSSLCDLIGRDKRVEVICAADVRQIMSFGAAGAMLGGVSSAVDKLEERLQKTDAVVDARLVRQGEVNLLLVQGGPTLSGSSAVSMAMERAVVRLETKGKTSEAIIGRLPDVAARVVAGLVAPVVQKAPPPPPPAPLAGQ
jgi:hypothetical protein